MPFSCRICIDCKSNVATTAMFLIQLHPITDRHIQPNHASYCRSCAQCRYDSDSKSKAEPKYFGYLIDMEIFEYLHQTQDGSPAEILHQCGIFLHKKSRNLAALLQHLGIILLSLCYFYFGIKVRESEEFLGISRNSLCYSGKVTHARAVSKKESNK